MLFRMCYQVLGGHTHVRVFAGEGTLSLGHCGELAFRNEEWTAFQQNLYRFMQPGSDIEVVQEACEHPNSEHLADNSSCSTGRIDWCPQCGAIAIDRKWRSVEP